MAASMHECLGQGQMSVLSKKAAVGLCGHIMGIILQYGSMRA